VPLCGYSLHTFGPGGSELAVLAARPHSMGGARLGFGRHLRRVFAVDSLEASARRLTALIDECPHSRLVVLAHNGPTGLGETRADIWGCDFRAGEGDFGDPDLRAAIDHADAVGKRVVAVVAGHMHHGLRGGGTRQWQVHAEGRLYVNAARVPRVFRENGVVLRHHVALEIDGADAVAREVLVSDGGVASRPPGRSSSA
jgi:uncharacterized protein (TIGR04168 family)